MDLKKTICLVFVFVIPIIAVFLTSHFIGFSSLDAGDEVEFRPPSWFFSVIWSILLLILGYCMSDSVYILMEKSYPGNITRKMIIATLVLYFIITVLLCLWLYLYSDDYKEFKARVLNILKMSDSEYKLQTNEVSSYSINNQDNVDAITELENIIHCD